MSTFKGQHFLNFDAPAQAHSATSRAAAADQTPGKKDSDKERILAVLREYGPLTDEAIGERTGIGMNTVRPRRVDLVRDGLVVAVDEGRTRAGKRATRWGMM